MLRYRAAVRTHYIARAVFRLALLHSLHFPSYRIPRTRWHYGDHPLVLIRLRNSAVGPDVI